jgi:hypothetical protein
MATFGYPSFYANGLNSNTQLRRSTDMAYQRGGTYEVILTGDTLFSSMELDVDLYTEGLKVGRMSLVPYNIQLNGFTYIYSFNLRPYDYMSNYIQSQHYGYYWFNNFTGTTSQINWNNPFTNSVTANYKYGYRYTNTSGGTITEYSGNTPTNDLNHFSPIPNYETQTYYTPSGFTNTGNMFDYVGGQFQMSENNYFLQNYDQEIGTTIGTGLTINTDIFTRLSPMSTYLLDYPTLPEQSETSRFLTDAPRIQYIQSSENYVLSYLNGQTGDRQVIEADFVKINLYDYSNTLITGYTQELNFSGTTYASPTGYTDTLQIFQLPCGPVDITNIFSTGQTWSNVAYYTVQLYYGYPTNVTNRFGNGPIGPLSERFYFYLYNNCRPENTRIAFLNQRGGFDYYTFTAYRQDTRKITAQSYDSRYYSPDLNVPDRQVGRSTKTFGMDVSQEFVVETEYISIPISNWLEQLFYSTQVYEMKPDYISPLDSPNKIYKDLRPLQVISTQVDVLTKKHQKLNKYRITFKSADNYFANKGF